MKVKSLSRVRLFSTPWTAAYQAPLSMGFSRQEYWSGVPLPSPWTPLNSGKQTVWRIPSGNLENCYLRQFRFSREDYDLKAVKNGSGWTLTRQQKPGRVAWPIPPSLLTALGSSVESQPRMLRATTLLTPRLQRNYYIGNCWGIFSIVAPDTD